MNDIEKKQISLILKVKRYLFLLKQIGIDTSKSSFCYFSTYGINPGQAKLLLWLKKNDSKINYFKTIIIHILAISSLQNYIITKYAKRKYDNLFLTWGRKSHFNKNHFSDNFLKARSDNFKNSIFFVIYLDRDLPKTIPSNVILFHKINKSRSILFLCKIIIKTIIRSNFNLNKIFHYLSSQTVFAELLNEKIIKIQSDTNFKKIIMPYEGQPYQNFVIQNLKNKITNFKSIGVIHSILPALPLNLIKREGSPSYIYVSGDAQKKVLMKFFGWKKKQIILTKSLRFNKKLDKKILGSIFFPINLNNISKISLFFEKFLISSKEKSLPIMKIRNHPQMLDSVNHQLLEICLNKLLKKYKNKFSRKVKQNICLFIGTTSAVIEFLEKNVFIVHLPIYNEFDIYTRKIWSVIDSSMKNKVFYYEIKNKNKLVKLSDSGYSFKKLNII